MDCKTRTIITMDGSNINEMPVLKINTQGDAVILLQKLLLYYGYLTSDILTGYYGSRTEVAVRNYQLDRGLMSDGVVNQQTWQVLINNLPIPS